MMRNALGTYIHIFCVYICLSVRHIYMYVSLCQFFSSKITTFKRSRDSHLCNENHRLETKNVFRINFLILWMKESEKNL